jgi:pilus assembly protein CpaF
MRITPAFGRRGAQTAGVSEAPQEPVAPPPPTPAEPANDPSSSPQDALMNELRQQCLSRLDPAAIANSSAEALVPEVELLIAEIANQRRIQLNAREQRQIATELVDDMLGLGPLEPLLDDDTISDIMVNSPTTTFVERKGKVYAAPVRFRDTSHLINVCQRIAAAVGRRVDESSPMVDARLKDGSRVNIVLPPLALDGPYISIRKFGKKSIDFAKLVEFGAMTKPVSRILEICAQIRLNVIISGGTGSGKTTLLNAMSRLIDPGERVVTIEDAAELQLQQPHVVRLETRPANLEGKGEINQRDLVKNALRMRPDRVIIGEVRGSEAFDMLQAMNTGHDGSMSTIHANNTRDAIIRVENMVQMGSMGLPLAAIRTQIVSAVDVILQVERQRDGGRRLTQVTEVCGMEGDVVLLNDIFKFQIDGEGPDGRLQGHYDVVRARPSFASRISYFGLEHVWNQALNDAELGA